MIRDQFQQWLCERLEEKDFIDFFGPVYDTKPEEFTFSCGDIKMMLQISEYVRSTVQKKGYEHFNGENCMYPKSTIQRKPYISDADEADIHDKLFNGILDLLQPYGENVVSRFEKNMATVTNEGDVIKGRVRCILCDTQFEHEKKKRKKNQEFYSQYWNGSSWCFSNYANHHLRKIHPIQKSSDGLYGEKSDAKEDLSMMNSQFTSRADELNENSNDENSDSKGMLRFEKHFGKKL